jgi:hypothetical protein
MTLKGFHIVFITFATLLALCVGGWCLWLNMMFGAPAYIAGALCSFAIAVALFVYGIWFYRKMKRLRLFT